MSTAERDIDRAELTAAVSPVSSLKSAQREGLWALFSQFYEHVERASFLADLEAKDDIILLWSPAGTVAGFSTLQLQALPVSSLPGEEASAGELLVVFSGDTIIEPRYWGQTALQVAFFHYVVNVKQQHRDEQVYWHLISKGYKTYLLMTRNFPNCWPRVGRETPALPAKILDHISRERFGSAWYPGRGIIQHAASMGRLREQVAPIGEPLLADPDIAFFVAHNPGHVDGDELSCLAAVDEDFIRYCGAKFA